MNNRDFVYWLQGYMEIKNPKSIDKQELQIIKDHIKHTIESESKQQPLPYGTISSLMGPNTTLTIC